MCCKINAPTVMTPAKRAAPVNVVTLSSKFSFALFLISILFTKARYSWLICSSSWVSHSQKCFSICVGRYFHSLSLASILNLLRFFSKSSLVNFFILFTGKPWTKKNILNTTYLGNHRLQRHHLLWGIFFLRPPLSHFMKIIVNYLEYTWMLLSSLTQYCISWQKNCLIIMLVSYGILI